MIGTITGHPHDYRLTVGPWFRSIFYLHPDTALIVKAPIGYQLHVLAAWALIAFWPFSRLVHVFSAPVGYLTRPYIVDRSRGAGLGNRPARRGWERVGS
jgi:nitrate reductase gamma subunit